MDPIETAYATLVQHLLGTNPTPSELANMRNTPARAAKAFREMNVSYATIRARVGEIIATGFPMEPTPYIPDMITQGPIHLTSLCPHHLLLVHYECFIGYIPVVNGPVLGLSKLARVAIELGRRPVLHEQLSRDIADVFHANGDMLSASYPKLTKGERIRRAAQTLLYEHGARLTTRDVMERLPGDVVAMLSKRSPVSDLNNVLTKYPAFSRSVEAVPGGTGSHRWGGWRLVPQAMELYPITDEPAILAPQPRWPAIESAGSIVVLTGRHSCMACRGVHSEALTTTTTRRGCFEEGALESKFNQTVNNIRASSI